MPLRKNNSIFVIPGVTRKFDERANRKTRLSRQDVLEYYRLLKRDFFFDREHAKSERRIFLRNKIFFLNLFNYSPYDLFFFWLTFNLPPTPNNVKFDFEKFKSEKPQLLFKLQYVYN